MTAAAPAPKKHPLSAYLQPKTLQMLVLGFSSGLPFLLVGNTLGYWLRDEGTSLSAIGYISWVGIAYSLKFLWAPLIDRVNAPVFGFLGRRRSWMALSQVIVGAALVAMAFVDTRYGLVVLGAFALVAAFSAATQDIVIDAWRIESSADEEELGLLSSAYQFGFRVALLATDAIILAIAERYGWNFSYVLYGALMAIGFAATLVCREPRRVEISDLIGGATDTAAGSAHVPSKRWTDAAGYALLASAFATIAILVLAQPSAFGICFALISIACAICAFAGQLRPAMIVSGACGAFLIGLALVELVEPFGLGSVLYVSGGLFLLAAALIASETVLAGALEQPDTLPLGSARGLFVAIAGPFVMFLKTHGGIALLMLLAISCYRVPDFLMGPMVNPYYHDIGLAKDTVAWVRGTFSFAASFVGIAAGGFCALRFGYLRAMILGGILQALAIAAFALLAYTKTDLASFIAVMIFDSVATSFAGVALVSYMSSLTSLGYTATQYALLASSYTMLGKFLKGFSGKVVDSLSAGSDLFHAYAVFFVGCGLVGIPGVILFVILARIHASRDATA